MAATPCRSEFTDVDLLSGAEREVVLAEVRRLNPACSFPTIVIGDHVIVINAEKAVLTGNKESQKIYRRHSGYPGGLTEIPAGKVRAKRPIRLVEDAIKGMLPKTKMGKQMYRKLKVYAGDKHPHIAQQPKAMAAAE
ncbi:MAG: 50S ribosomal protein L13 [Acidobacteria bacterium]|nr:50S ribosomal protein L13 [Acidobacteriota bacterium]